MRIRRNLKHYCNPYLRTMQGQVQDFPEIIYHLAVTPVESKTRISDGRGLDSLPCHTTSAFLSKLTCRIQNPDIPRAGQGPAGPSRAGRGEARRGGLARGEAGRGGARRGGTEAGQSGAPRARPLVFDPQNGKQPSRTLLRKHERMKSYVNRTKEHDERLTTG